MINRMIKAVIFDMDGVIIDSEPVYMARQEAYLTARGWQYRPGELNCLVGASNREGWEFLWRLSGSKMTMEELKEDYRRYQAGQPPIRYTEILNPGFCRTADKLKERGVRLALASSSPLEHIHVVLKECRIEDRFEVVVSGQQFTKSKPDPEIYQYTLSRLGLHAGESIAVEDSAYGIEAAKAAGLTCIALRETRFGFRQEAADYRIETLPELLYYI